MKSLKLIVIISLFSISSSVAQAENSSLIAACSKAASSLVSKVTSMLAVVAHVGPQPKCEEVARTTTCTATFYGKGDGFTGGTTACGNRFRPTVEKTIAIKTASNGGFFDRSLCGKKAIVTTKDPRTGLSKSVEVRITDSGSMGGRSSRRCMDLSYRAASELGIVDRGVASNTTIKVCK